MIYVVDDCLRSPWLLSSEMCRPNIVVSCALKFDYSLCLLFMRLTVRNLPAERDTISRGSTEVLDRDHCLRSRDYWDEIVSMTVSILQPSSMVSSVESAPEWQPLAFDESGAPCV